MASASTSAAPTYVVEMQVLNVEAFEPRVTKVLALPRSRCVQLGIEKTAQVVPDERTGHAAAVRRAATASPAVGSTRARSIGANAER